jgi:hypothetical protein
MPTSGDFVSRAANFASAASGHDDSTHTKIDAWQPG